ncbi:hypothetical protein BJX76DRAFT_94544 [Aspergillus varians]
MWLSWRTNNDIMPSAFFTYRPGAGTTAACLAHQFSNRQFLPRSISICALHNAVSPSTNPIMVEEHPPLNSPRSPPAADPVGSDRPRPESSSHTGTSTRSSRSSDDWDHNTLELHEIETQHEDESDGSISSGEERIITQRTVSRTSQRSRAPRQGILGDIQRFWMRNVALTVEQKKNRDYFALERTFLAYIRTSVVLAMQGVLIAQLFRLQSANTTQGLGYHEVGVPLSVTCYCAAILTAMLGAHRFWKQQGAIALGTVFVGGWELNCIAFVMTAVSNTPMVS